ncbi:MAG: hypothetical protein KNN13_07475 [Hydrogenobacter thermophilus]|uniref:multiheme c-type cytochrome n=1 Tax=Hydrogenobacter thermophilus TaxID=940 RepID=UPI001C73EBE8|nr:ammonia-forming cytochrome c nitrite reductase subunit c552 [Hydrogenobacter thermophilus]QWK19334.1 MAG: hypothetical protein KNN13_07475 [Hydrogenobacter thermophilus]
MTFAFLLSCKERYTTVEEYWKRPIKPNGDPPANYSTLEASLDPKACASCHTDKYDEWKNSLHSKTVSSGFLWQLKMMDQLSANKCMDCHAPLSEQKALMSIYMDYPSKPAKPVPAYIAHDLHSQGIVCAACHVREHVRYGPPPKRPLPSAIPHGGFEVRKFFEDSKFCASCHQFPDGGERTNGKLRENTYEEWRNSRFYLKGITCQSCHMPNRKHIWKGIHDKDTVLKALKVETWIAGSELNVRLTNVGAGHNLPTYMVPKIVVEVYQEDKKVVEGIIGWMVDEYDLSKEVFDKRISPGSSITFTGKLINLEKPINLLIRVEPEEHYYRAFSRYLKDNKDRLQPDVLNFLKDAIQKAKSAEYTLLNFVLYPKELVKGRYILSNGSTF